MDLRRSALQPSLHPPRSFRPDSPPEAQVRHDPKLIISKERIQNDHRVGEILCINYAAIYNLPIMIARPFNIFGLGIRIDELVHHARRLLGEAGLWSWKFSTTGDRHRFVWRARRDWLRTT